MEQKEIVDGLVVKFETWADSLEPEERGLLGGLLSRWSQDEVQGYSLGQLPSATLLGNHLRELLLLNL